MWSWINVGEKQCREKRGDGFRVATGLRRLERRLGSNKWRSVG
jgi:hypothetical protein